MLKKILAVLAVIVVVFLIAAAMQPEDFRVERSATVNATPETVFPQINDMQAWQSWSPWAKLDPAAKNTFEGPISGEGAALHWVGNSQVGEGRMTITQSRPNEFVQFRLDFVKPFAGTHTAEFTLVPEGNGTKVTWAMFGKNNFIGKAMSLIFNCDKMVGEQFEKGLANLKAIVEVPAAPAADPAVTEEVTTPPSE